MIYWKIYHKIIITDRQCIDEMCVLCAVIIPFLSFEQHSNELKGL